MGYTVKKPRDSLKESILKHLGLHEPHNRWTLIRSEIREYNRGLTFTREFYTTTVYTMRGDPMEPGEYFTVIRTNDVKVYRQVMSKIGEWFKCDNNYADVFYDPRIEREIEKLLGL